MDIKRNKEFDIKIIEEVRKNGREFLYQLGEKNYRNTCMKANTWREISEVVGMTPVECMKRWKSMRSRFVKLNKQAKSGSAAGPSNAKDQWLMRELNFLKVHIINEPTISSFGSNVNGVLFQDLFDSTADDILIDFVPENPASPPLIIEEAPSAEISPRNTPQPSSARPTGAFQPSSRREPARKKTRVEINEDPNIALICDTMRKNQEMLKGVISNVCLLKTFAETWSSEFGSWARSEQSAFFHEITVLIEEKNRQQKQQHSNLDNYE